MNKALVLSVPGTGSRFTMNYLVSCLGYERKMLLPKDLNPKPRRKPRNTPLPFASLQHVNASPQQILRPLVKLEGLKTVIPLRAPVHQFLSRMGEASNPENVKEESKTFWKLLKELKDDFDYVFLPIEEDMDRAGRLMLVANHLGAVPDDDVFEEIVANWAKVGSNGVKPLRVEYDKRGNVSVGGFDMSFLDEEMAWYAGLIEEYREGLAT